MANVDSHIYKCNELAHMKRGHIDVDECNLRAGDKSWTAKDVERAIQSEALLHKMPAARGKRKRAT